MDVSDYLERLFHHTPRPGIQALFEEIQLAERNGKSPIVVLEAPTSYGKTEASVALAAWLVKESNLAERLIHVLPLRAIVEESYGVAKDALIRTFPDVAVGAQAMHLLDMEKSPFFLRRLVYTTIDSFVYNLFKLPVAEPDRDYSHFDIPRYAIYSAFQVFDEAHYFAGDDPPREGIKGYQNRMFAAFRASLSALAQGGVPLAIVTATMPMTFIKAVLETISTFNRELVHIKVGVGEYKKLGHFKELCVQDRDFFEERRALEALTRIIDEVDILRLVSDHSSCGDNILIVRNTVNKAVDIYQRLRAQGKDDVLLIHGRMTVGDRKRVLEEAKSKLERQACVLISTQIIEAGVNLDFDVIITDAAPMANLIQRIGRVGRRPRKQSRIIRAYIVEGDGDGVYESELTSRSIQVLREVSSHQGEEFYVGWRMPEKTTINGQDIPGFLAILENAYQNWTINWDKKLSTVLSEIDRYWQVNPRDIREYARNMCSLVRTSGVISLAVLEKDHEDLGDASVKTVWEQIQDNLVTVDLPWLLQRWEKVLDLDREKAIVRYISIYEDINRIFIKEEENHDLFNLFKNGGYNCAFLNKLNQFLRKKSNRFMHPVALKVSRGAYTSRGLLA
jgi:CRISPR-associated endonuclease/helicase Cas3